MYLNNMCIYNIVFPNYNDAASFTQLHMHDIVQYMGIAVCMYIRMNPKKPEYEVHSCKEIQSTNVYFQY